MWRALVQFAVLGSALFALDRLAGGGDPPEPVVIPAARVAALHDELARALGRPPGEADLARAVAPEVDDALLFREALARGYDRDDPVVFRRLVQNLRFAGAPEDRDDASLYREALALGMQHSDVVVRRRLVQRMRLDLEAEADAPEEPALRAHYERHHAAYRSPARARFHQLYFALESEARAARLLAELREAETGPDAARERGEPFLYPPEQPPQTRRELADRFGGPFADGVFAAPTGSWHGPVASAYGVHLVFVSEREPERALGFDEVRDAVRYAVIVERRREALERGLSRLRADAVVRVERPDGAR